MECSISNLFLSGLSSLGYHIAFSVIQYTSDLSNSRHKMSLISSDDFIMHKGSINKGSTERKK